MTIAPPAATGNAGAGFEAKVGAFYLLALLTTGEPRGLPQAVARSAQFQGAADGRPFDDVIVKAMNADGSPAVLEVQAKRTMDFTATDPEFRDLVSRLWAASQLSEFRSSRYEMAVAIARTSTQIERPYQEALHWTRRHISAADFHRHLNLLGYAPDGMRRFVAAFRGHLDAAGATSDDETVWGLLRHFQILPFDFEATGSLVEDVARERARLALDPDQADRASDLWMALADVSVSHSRAGGEIDRGTLLRELTEIRGFRLEGRRDLRGVRSKIAEASSLALADIRDQVGGIGLARSNLVEDCHVILEGNRLVEIAGPSGVGKSAILKGLAIRMTTEGAVIVLAPGRIPGGGWPQLARTLGCEISLSELLNELAAGGCATLFLDNIDQIDNDAEQITLRDLLRGVAANPAWTAVVTIRTGSSEWRSNLDAVRDFTSDTVRVGEMTDLEAEVLSASNPALGALLVSNHPARALARNLFHLSRLLDLHASQGTAPVSETGLARLWWRYGGTRAEGGRSERLKVLRNLAGRVIESPGVVMHRIEEFDGSVVEELIHSETLREQHPGATAAFYHDVLRDWAIGLVLDENPDLITGLPLTTPMPGTLSRGIELAARLSLESDPTGARWLTVLAAMEAAGSHGSWQRPVLLGLLRSESAAELLDRLHVKLVEDRGRRLGEMIRLVIAVESEPISRLIARSGIEIPIDQPIPDSIVVPTTASWVRLVHWIVAHIDTIPTALVPDLCKLFQAWLVVTNERASINPVIVACLYRWLTDFERRGNWRERGVIYIESDRWREVREDVRTTFLMFSHLQPALAAQYLNDLRAERPRYHDFNSILKYPGSLPTAAPAEFVDLILAELIREDDSEHFSSRRYSLNPFDIHDSDFFPASPGQGPFFALLESAPQEGLRLIRTLVERAARWRIEHPTNRGITSPTITVPFPDGDRTYVGDFGAYQWARGGTGSTTVASALMALEAWGHKQIEAGVPFKTVMDDVLGPDGSSVAFLCAAVDLALSHWDAAREDAWPLAASPKLLQFDDLRHSQDISGLGRFFTPEAEPSSWRVKLADLTGRASRGSCLIEQIGSLALYGPPQILAKLANSLEAARQHLEGKQLPDDENRIHGLRETAKRAVRMADRQNWVPRRARLKDGREIDVFQFAPSDDDIEAVNTARTKVEADMAESSIRLTLQRAILEPSTSTPEIVAAGIQWAKGDPPHAEGEENDKWHAEWRERAVVMAAALAARDYEGEDRHGLEEWSRPILDRAAAWRTEDIEALHTEQIYSNRAAIAVLGLAALYRRNPTDNALNLLFRLATRRDLAVLVAIATQLNKLGETDARLPRSFVRVALSAAVRPERSEDDETNGRGQKNHGRRIAKVIQAERQWLNDERAEPRWPKLPLWPSRRRRTFRIGPPLHDDEVGLARPTKSSTFYVDEHVISALVSGVSVFVREAPVWVLDLADYLLGWTIEANNGPPDEDDGHDRENRPYHWNAHFFGFLGRLCSFMAFADSRTRYLELITSLHETAFHDALPAFLNGIDQTTPVDAEGDVPPVAVRRLFAEHLIRGRRWQYWSQEKSLTAEIHLGHALCSMFFHTPRMGVAEPRTYLPDRWQLLPICMPIFDVLVAAAPLSGYVADLFLKIVETSPTGPLLPHLVKATGIWADAWGIDPEYWAERQFGNRVCSWLNAVLTNDTTAEGYLAGLEDTLIWGLDVMIRSGCTNAHGLETWLSTHRSVSHQN